MRLVSFDSVTALGPTQGQFSEENSREKELQLPVYDISTIVAATENFSASNKIGEGGFGTVYKVIKFMRNMPFSLLHLNPCNIIYILDIYTFVKVPRNWEVILFMVMEGCFRANFMRGHFCKYKDIYVNKSCI